jgi:hypothetical protein
MIFSAREVEQSGGSKGLDEAARVLLAIGDVVMVSAASSTKGGRIVRRMDREQVGRLFSGY